MEAPSRSSRAFDDDDDDDEAPHLEGSSQSHRLGEVNVRVDGRGSSGDQQPSTPRSKHSATEQRRRSKINDRFQILRELIPHSDQKRDKASFLLEVIEYIQFLQEKAQKYESAYPEWNHENAKLMPWEKVYYRSIWKNAQNNSQSLGDGISDPSHVMRNGVASLMFSGKPDESNIPVAPLHPCEQNPIESDNMSAGVSFKEMENPSAFANNIASQCQGQCLRSSGLDDCTIGSDMLSEQDLAIDEGTISVSSIYSQGLLTTLTQVLQSSGIDLSQASISVQINLGKRANSKRLNAAASEKDHDPSSGNQAIEQSRVGISCDESEQVPKRQKADISSARIATL